MLMSLSQVVLLFAYTGDIFVRTITISLDDSRRIRIR